MSTTRTLREQRDEFANMSTKFNEDIEREVIHASSELKAGRRKTGVVQMQTDIISEPTARHHPVFLNAEDPENWKMRAEHHAMDRITKTENDNFEEIKIGNILQDVKTSRGILKKCGKVLFLGPAGMGKTTVLNRLAFHELLEKKIVIMPDFRIFGSSQKVRPSQALLSRMFSDNDSERMKQRFQWIRENSDKVAIIVDSLDTMPFNFDRERQPIHDDEEAELDVIVHSLLSGSLLPGSIILLFCEIIIRFSYCIKTLTRVFDL